jgi:hypothetical protein
MVRAVAPGFPHHITQRGNRRQQTFFSDQDYQSYLTLMAEWCVKLFDGIPFEPVFDAGVVVIQSPEGFGTCAGRPQAEYFSNGVGQSDTRELIQKPFKETGTETGRFENDIGTDFHLGQVPVVFQVFGLDRVAYFPLSNLKNRFIQ